MAYCSAAEVRARMPELPSTDDTLIDTIAAAVTAYFDNEMGHNFTAEAAVLRLFSGTGTRKLFIRPSLASAPTLVRVRDNTAGTWRTVPLTDLHYMPEGRDTGDPIQWLEIRDTITGTDSVWPWADESAEVTGTWNATAIPADLKEAAIQTVINLYRARGSAGTDMEVGIGGTYMPAIPKAVPAFAWQIIQNYRKLVFA